MIRSLYAVPAMLCLAAAVTGPAAAQPTERPPTTVAATSETGVIRGRVSDASGGAIEGARVEVVPRGSGTTAAAA